MIGSFFTRRPARIRAVRPLRMYAVLLAGCLATGVVLASCSSDDGATTGSQQTAESQPVGATTSSPSPTGSGVTDSSSGGPATTAPRSGEMLFASYCAGCHGNDGKAQFAPTVVGLSAIAVKTAAEEGTGSMPGFADRLSAADIDAVVAYVGTLK